MQPLILILACLAVSFVFAKLLARFRVPEVIAPILIGICLSLPLFRSYLTAADISLLEALSGLGIVFLMFFLGLKLNLPTLGKEVKIPFLIALCAFLLPPVLGSTVSYLLFDMALLTSLFVGFCISVSSAAIAIVILKDQNLTNSSIGQNLLGAQIIDDFFGFLVLLLVVPLVRVIQGEFNILIIIFDFLIFFTLIYLTRYIIVPAVLHLIDKRSPKVDLFIVSLLMVLLMSIASTYLGVDSLLGAFIGGIVVRYTVLSSGTKDAIREERDVTELVEVATFGFLAPFFFIWLGFHVDIAAFVHTHYLFVMALVAVAFAGKFFGAMIGNSIGQGSQKESIPLGFGMNVRGELELVLAEIGRVAGILSPPVFAAIIVMSIVTTFLSAVMFKVSVTSHKKISEQPKRDWRKSRLLKSTG